jgi:hypothetical protein
MSINMINEKINSTEDDDSNLLRIKLSSKDNLINSDSDEMLVKTPYTKIMEWFIVK